MADLQELRKAAREIFDVALRSVDARIATRRAVHVDGSLLRCFEAEFDLSTKQVYVVGIGKAALGMALGLNDELGTKIVGGVISGPAQLTKHPFSLTGWQVFAGGHPLPNEASLAAAQAIFELIDRANAERAMVIFLISGGGSAMVEWPTEEHITLGDLREANRLLVECGATIGEINAVRRTFSAVKGGALARRGLQASMVTLIVSDTNQGDEASVASGPTLSPPANGSDPREVLIRYQLGVALPQSIIQAITQTNLSERQIQKANPHYVILDNQTAIAAALEKVQALGFASEVASDICEQPIDKGCGLLISRLSSLLKKSAVNNRGFCLISGGEFSCPVRGEGRGGRNLETALRCAIELDNKESVYHSVVLSAGTDGIDGNSPSAGAIADEETLSRARLSGLDAREFLERSDSYGFFDQLDDLIETGPTGTNVRDLRIVLTAGKLQGNHTS
jgi:glycerate 2-kinase